MYLTYAAVKNDQVCWMDLSMEIGKNTLAELQVEQGSEVRHVLDLFRKLQSQSQSWWDSLNGPLPAAQEAIGQVLAGEWNGERYARAKGRLTPGQTVPLELTSRKRKELPADDRNLTVLLDIPARTLSVSGGPDMADMDLTLTLEDEAAVSLIETYGVSIGYGLGTNRAQYKRLFRSPWRRIAQCLREPDPEQSMREAAAADILRGRLHVLTDRQCRRSEMEFLCVVEESIPRKGQLRGLSVPDIFGGAAVAIPFVTRRDRGTSMFLPCVEDEYRPDRNGKIPDRALELAAAPGERDPLLALVKAVDGDRTGRLRQRLADFAWTIHMADLSKEIYRYNSELAAVVLAYARTCLPRKRAELREQVLPGTNLPLRWVEVRNWMNELSWDKTELNQDVVRGPDSAPLLFEDPSQGWKETTWGSLRLKLDGILLESAGNGTILQMKNRMRDTLEVEIGAARMAGQHVYLMDLTRPQTAARARLVHDGAHFILHTETGPEGELSVADFCECGGEVHANRARLVDGMDIAERRFLILVPLLEERDFAAPEVRAAQLALEKDAERKDKLEFYTVPTGWKYTIAKFRDGAIGVAYGPRNPNESYEECVRRLYREAARQPSENALCLL